MTYAVKLERSVQLRLPASTRLTEQNWAAWAAKQRRPLAVDLFAGGGGLSLGLERAGYRVGLAVDHEPRAVETHAHNFRGLALQRDLSDPEQVQALITLLQDTPIALVAGGPPCQPFSRAGRSKIRSLVRDGVRNAVDERGSLWRAFLRIALAVRPDAVLLENVPDMALGDELVVVRCIVAELEAAGYDTHVQLVDAWRHGVPQHRQRLILAATREGATFRWPRSRRPITLWDAIGDLPPLGESTGGRELSYNRRQQLTRFQQRARSSMRSDELRDLIWDHQTRPVRDDDRRAFALMTSTTRYSDLPEELRRYGHESFNDKYKRLGRDELSRSITAHIAKDGYWYIHPLEQRTLTVREAARLQTFPDHYRFAGGRSDAFRQIGNAVPPTLAQAIGRALLQATARRVHQDEQEPRVGTTARLGREHITKLHDELVAWARNDRVRRPWAYPADAPSAEHNWAVLVSTLLLSGRAEEPVVDRVLLAAPAPGPEAATQLMRAAERESAGARRALLRLAESPALTPAGGEPADETTTGPRWQSVLRLGAAERDRYAALAHGEDRVLVSAGVRRVAARVTGTDVDRVRQRSDGRIATARLIGSGPDAPLRMAALVTIGATICTEGAAACAACPLLRFCPGPTEVS